MARNILRERAEGRNVHQRKKAPTAGHEQGQRGRRNGHISAENRGYREKQQASRSHENGRAVMPTIRWAKPANRLREAANNRTLYNQIGADNRVKIKAH
jgi:hypothetical protein